MNCEEIINLNPEGAETINLNPEGGEEPLQINGECLCVVPFEDRDYNKSFNKPQINGVELIGDKTSEELKIVEDKNYVHAQTTASDSWTIIHNLNKLPSVTVIDSAEEEVIGEITYDSVNQLTIKFTAPFKGKATLN